MTLEVSCYNTMVNGVFYTGLVRIIFVTLLMIVSAGMIAWALRDSLETNEYGTRKGFSESTGVMTGAAIVILIFASVAWMVNMPDVLAPEAEIIRNYRGQCGKVTVK